jgi:hypothetical protein
VRRISSAPLGLYLITRQRVFPAACLTPCFISHRLKKQHSVVFPALTRNPLQRRPSKDGLFYFFFPVLYLFFVYVVNVLFGRYRFYFSELEFYSIVVMGDGEFVKIFLRENILKI